MATVTLTGDTNYSALTLANDDTIACAGFILTLDIQPIETGIQVTSVGTNGRVVFSGAWNLPTWDFFAGASTSSGMINTLPVGATIKSIRGGSGVLSHGIGTNSGTVITCTGGSGGSARGIQTNNGVVTSSIGGTGNGAHGIDINNAGCTVTTATGGTTGNQKGVNTNNGTVITANGGGINGSTGINTNNGTVTTANGGTTAGAYGININGYSGIVTTVNGGTGVGGFGIATNNGRVTSVIGGSSATVYGISTNNGYCLRLTDSTGRAVLTWNGTMAFVEGAYINGTIPSNIKTIYTLGTLSELAVIAGDATVITMSEGSGSGNPMAAFVHGLHVGRSGA
jgi:hypothetical protein